MNLPEPNTVEIFVNSKSLDNLKILHLSDLHINTKTSNDKLVSLVEICNSLEFDFTVISGDLIDCKVKYIVDKLQILNKIRKKVYYISGNHDLFYGIDDLKEQLNHFIFMDNKCSSIKFNDTNIHIAGLSDRFSNFFGIKREIDKISTFLKSYDATIFLSHQPKDYKIAVDTNSSLFLCGHTHGGQIFPFHYLVRLVQPFLAGLIYKNKTAIYVNRGLGNWGINYRFKAPNEITILKLISNSVE